MEAISQTRSSDISESCAASYDDPGYMTEDIWSYENGYSSNSASCATETHEGFLESIFRSVGSFFEGVFNSIFGTSTSSASNTKSLSFAGDDKVYTGNISDPVTWVPDSGQPEPDTATQYAKFDYPLFLDSGPTAENVSQGAPGDCYFVNALASLAETDPQAIVNMIKDNGDGTYTVTFHDPSNNMKEVQIAVDNSLPVAPVEAYSDFNGNIQTYKPYGADVQGGLWVAIVEKAYAAWTGSYVSISNSVNDIILPGYALEMLTGDRYNEITTNLSDGELVRTINNATQNGMPMTASYVDVVISGAGAHTVGILGTTEENGQAYILMSDGSKLTTSEFRDMYQTMSKPSDGNIFSYFFDGIAAGLNTLSNIVIGFIKSIFST